jgi:hypothetical protein
LSGRYRTFEKHLEEATSIFEPVFISEDGEQFVV